MKRVLPSVCLALLPLLFSGCYLMKQGAALLRYQRRAEDIESVLQNRELDPDVRSMLEETRTIKHYAAEELHLNRDENYTRYVHTDREYLVSVVSACKKTAFEPHTWSFPFFGSFPYKGYYHREDAEKEADRLREKGYDVLVRKVDAFSTLGYFKDPMYTFMKDYSSYALASLIIHEQTHATIFLKDQVQFNEELATFVGEKGALAYLRENYGEDSAPYRYAIEYEQDLTNFYNLIRILYRQLDDLYAQELDRKTTLERKARIIEEFTTELQQHYHLYFSTDRFKTMVDIPVNNAYIMTIVRYTKDLSLFNDLYEMMNRDIRKTIEVIKPVEEYPGPPKEYLRELTR